MDDDTADLRTYAATGAPDAFAALVRRHVDLVYSAALRQVRDPHLAEDLTQAVFVLLARKAGGLAASRTPVAGWLVGAARLVAKNALRQLARRRKHEQKAAQMTSETRAPDDASPDDAWRAIAPHLDDALAGLGGLDRAAVVLRYFQNRSLREVGAALGVSEAAAKQRVHRAVGKLRGLLRSRGVCVPAAALLAVLSTNAVVAAPPALAGAAVLTATAATTPHLAALVKGAGWVMNWSSIKTTVITAAAILLVGAPAAVVTYRATRPDAQARPMGNAPVILAMAPPAAAEAPPSPQPEGDWRSRFNAAYRLDPGIPLKRVPPPFMPERQRYFEERDRQGARPGNLRRMFDWDKGIALFHDEGGTVGWNRWTRDEPTVGNVFRFVCGVPSYKLVMDEFDRMRPLEGDWVVRPGATEAERVAVLIETLNPALGGSVKIEKRAIEREVFVARGKLKVAAAPEAPGQPPLLYVTLEKRKGVNNRAIGELPDLLRVLGELMNTEVIDESDPAASKGQHLYWTNQVPGAVAGPFRDKLLKNIADQTGLTFKSERRKLDTWVAEATK